jgi:PAS domain S-box-containing protein
MDFAQIQSKYKDLLNSPDTFRQLFESSNDAIMLLDEDGFFDCNQATLDMFKYNRKEDFCGKHPAQHSPKDQPEGADSMAMAAVHIKKALDTGKDSFEWVHRRSDGQDFPAEVLLTPLKHKDVTVLQATVRDITKKKENEEKMTSLNNIMTGRELKMIELKKRVAELEAELTKTAPNTIN